MSEGWRSTSSNSLSTGGGGAVTSSCPHHPPHYYYPLLLPGRATSSGEPSLKPQLPRVQLWWAVLDSVLNSVVFRFCLSPS